VLDAPRVLRITPALDWRAVHGAEAVAPRDAIGGLAAQVTRQARATAALGVDQTILGLRPAGAPDHGRLDPGVAVTAVGPAGVAGLHRRLLAWLVALLPALRRARGEVDVVHVHASGVIEPLLAALAARIVLARPVVVTLHCSAVATYVTQSRRDAAVQVLTRAAERLVIATAARTLVLTDRARRRLDHPRVRTLPDCIEAGRYATADGEGFARRHGVPRDRPVALFVGRASREKGAAALAGLAERLAGRGLHVLVCGDGPELPALAAAAQAARFTFAGAVTADEVAAALRCADVLVLPSVHEELGSVLLEAMAAGLPAVAYAVGGVGEAIVEGVTGLLVAPGDEEALARAVAAVLDDQTLAATARAEGPRRAAECYDVAVAGGRLAELYRELAA